MSVFWGDKFHFLRPRNSVYASGFSKFRNFARLPTYQPTCFVIRKHTGYKDSCISLPSTILLKNSREKSGKCSSSHCLDQPSATNHYVSTKIQFHSSSGLSIFRENDCKTDYRSFVKRTKRRGLKQKTVQDGWEPDSPKLIEFRENAGFRDFRVFHGIAETENSDLHIYLSIYLPTSLWMCRRVCGSDESWWQRWWWWWWWWWWVYNKQLRTGWRLGHLPGE